MKLEKQFSLTAQASKSTLTVRAYDAAVRKANSYQCYIHTNYFTKLLTGSSADLKESCGTAKGSQPFGRYKNNAPKQVKPKPLCVSHVRAKVVGYPVPEYSIFEKINAANSEQKSHL